jgi:hypothetical protein
MAESQRYAKVPAELSKAAWPPKSPHAARAGVFRGEGSSQAAALADLGGQLEAMAARAMARPSFWAGDQDDLWIAVPDPVTGGSVSYRITGVTVSPGAAVREVSFNAAPAGEAHESSEGMTRIPLR